MSPWLSDLYLSSQSDARLLGLTRDGHPRAFAILAERYRAELLAHARRVGAHGNAEDVVQQTFLSAFAALSAGAEVGHPRGWLHAILRHAASRVRRPADASLEGLDATGEPLELVVERRARIRSVITALDGLPSRQRQALLGSSVQGLSRAELASSLGVSEGAVRQLVHRGRQALRTAITALTPYPLARWLAAAGSSPGAGSDLAITAGAVSAGGVMAKVGVFAAAGVIATGIATVEVPRAVHPHHSQARHARAAGSVNTAAPRISAVAPAAGSGVGSYVADTDQRSSPGTGVAPRSSRGVSRHQASHATVRSTSPSSNSERGSGSDSGGGSGSGSGSDSGGGSGSGGSSGSDSGGGSGSGGSSGSDSGGGSGSGGSSGSDSGGGSGAGSGTDNGSGAATGSSGSDGNGSSVDSSSSTDSSSSSGGGGNSASGSGGGGDSGSGSGSGSDSASSS